MNYPLAALGLILFLFSWWLIIGALDEIGWFESRLAECQKDILALGKIDNIIKKDELRKQLSIEHGLLFWIAFLRRINNK